VRRLAVFLILAQGAAPALVHAQARCRLAEIQISPPDGTVSVGARLSLAATAYDSAGIPCDDVRFTWASSDANILDVDATGSALGISAGSAIVTARAGTGARVRSGQAVVRVVPRTTVFAPAPASPPVSASVDTATTAGFSMPAYNGRGSEDLVRYAGRLAQRSDSAFMALVEVFRNTSGAPTVGATSPMMVSSRERGRWRRCRLIHFDLVTQAEAAEFLRDSAAGPIGQAAGQLVAALAAFAATEECDNLSSMFEAPDRWTPWQQNYDNSARAFYRDWYAQLRSAHQAARELIRTVASVAPALAVDGSPPLPPRPPTLSAASQPPVIGAGGKSAPPVVRDSDGDGVMDPLDRCRGTQAGLRVDASGCPVAGGVVTAPAPLPVASQQAGAAQEILVIQVGESRDGVLEPGDWTMADGTWADIWYLRAASTTDVTIELRSRAFDAYLQLLDAAGTRLVEDDDGAGGGNSRIRFTLKPRVRYQIVVNNFGDQPVTGRYTLSVTR